MKNFLGVVFATILLGLFFLQVQGVAADKGNHKKPVSSPVTSPITCRPGFGFGDKNHCHVKQDKDDKGKHDTDKDNHDKGKDNKSDKDDHHEDRGRR